MFYASNSSLSFQCFSVVLNHFKNLLNILRLYLTGHWVTFLKALFFFCCKGCWLLLQTVLLSGNIVYSFFLFCLFSPVCFQWTIGPLAKACNFCVVYRIQRTVSTKCKTVVVIIGSSLGTHGKASIPDSQSNPVVLVQQGHMTHCVYGAEIEEARLSSG